MCFMNLQVLYLQFTEFAVYGFWVQLVAPRITLQLVLVGGIEP